MYTSLCVKRCLSNLIPRASFVLLLFVSLIAASCKSTPAVPLVQEPSFSITSIAVLQAELINTRLKVSLTIDNPNFFPVELSSFSYELYESGQFWASGKEGSVIHIPANSSISGDVYLLMNFIDMKRELLDRVVNLVSVSYRFEGEAEVRATVGKLPAFKTQFELSGVSQVRE